MIVACGVLRLRDDDSTDTQSEERLADVFFAFEAFVALCHNDIIAPHTGCFLDTREDCRKIIMGDLWHNDTDKFVRRKVTTPQRTCQFIGQETTSTGISLNALALLRTDKWTVLQRTGNSGYGNTQFPRDIFHR